jgi:hypothetical protein
MRLAQRFRCLVSALEGRRVQDFSTNRLVYIRHALKQLAIEAARAPKCLTGCVLRWQLWSQ